MQFFITVISQVWIANAAAISPRAPQLPASSGIAGLPDLGTLAGLLGGPLGASFGSQAASSAIGNILKNANLGNLAQSFLPSIKVAKIEELEPHIKGRTGTKRQLIRFGPQVLVGKGVSGLVVYYLWGLRRSDSCTAK